MQQSQKWDKIIRSLIYIAAFLLPLLLTPWTVEPLELSKQMLLYVVTSVALVIWLLKLLVLRNWRFVKTALDLPILIFLAVYFLASIFSVDRVMSFLGAYGTFSGNFFQVLFLVVFYYLVVNNFETPAQLRRLFAVFFSSAFLTIVYAVFQFAGLFAVRLPFAKAESFNTLGSLLMLTLFASFAVVLAFGFKTRGWFRFPGGLVWRILLVAASFIVLLTINFFYAWVALLVGLLVYMIFNVAFSPEFNIKNFLAPLGILVAIMALLVLQLVFQIGSLRSVLNFQLPVEVRLDYETAKPALKGVIFDRPVLGSGPGTFQYDFSQYREQAFNLSPFWSVRFDKAPSEAAEHLVGTGILGFLIFEILAAIFIMYAVFFLVRNRDRENWDLALALFSGFAVLWVAHWFFFFNTVLLFSFWLSIALFMALSRIAAGETVKTFDFSLESTPRQTVSIVSAVSLGLVLIIVFLFFSVSVYASDIFYRQGLILAGKTETFEAAQVRFERAIRLNRFRPDYHLSFAEYLLGRINRELSQKNPNVVQIQSWLADSINTARTAVALSPASGAAWERLANLYSFARPLIGGVDKFIIDSLISATENDKKNPVLYTELGQGYLLTAKNIDPAILGRGLDSDQDGLSDEQEKVLGSDSSNRDSNSDGVADGNEVLAGKNPATGQALPDSFVSKYVKVNQENLTKAEESFRKAIALKEDYAVAYYQLALALEQAGSNDKAMAELEAALAKLPGNLTFKFELGRLYFNANRIEDAARQFQDIVAVVPDNANSRFSLAVCFERLGKLSLALEQYRKVLEGDPENENIAGKVTELEKAVAASPK